MTTTYTYIVTREVVETIEVEADNAGEAEQAAAESMVALWTRDIKSEEVTGRINPKEAPRFQIDPTEAARLHRIGQLDLTERDQAEAVIKSSMDEYIESIAKRIDEVATPDSEWARERREGTR